MIIMKIILNMKLPVLIQERNLVKNVLKQKFLKVVKNVNKEHVKFMIRMIIMKIILT